MSEDDEKPLVLKREDLYELVWSKPLTELAADFRISDVALAKRCKKLGIPRPGRGYWARFDAGQRPHRPTLPKRAEKYQDTNALRLAPTYQSHSLVRLETDEGPSETTDAVLQKIAVLEVEPTRSIVEAQLAVRRTAVHLRHPLKAEIKFARGTKTGLVLPIHVSASSLDRALRLADMLLRAAASMGWPLVDESDTYENPLASNSSDRRATPPTVPKGCNPATNETTIRVDGEPIVFRIEERFRDEPREPTSAELTREKREWGYRAPRRTSVPTGHLRVVRMDHQARYWGPERRSWYDRKGNPVESQIRQILTGFYELAQLIKQRRAKAELEARERARQEQIRREREARQAAHSRLIRQLETDAGAWHRARYLRHYVRVARRTLRANTPQAQYLDQAVNFLDWAEGYIDQIDPLNETPRSDDYLADHGVYGELDRIKQSFARLLGTDWKQAWKRNKTFAPSTVSTDLWTNHERSVFQLKSDSDHASPTAT